ncbi:hypothetical protein LBMAG46_28620 [Planctomycetia bacterium]|nr:hypothetical protein LBMAG46_28620 [Planctomycetia bacterium]
MSAFRKLLLIYWCALALLGHAGTHALADYLGVCVHVDTQDARTTQAAVTGLAGARVASGHAGCQHCLRHQRKPLAAGAAGDCAGGSPDRSGSHSGHDAANCRLCDWFLKFTPQGLSVQPCLLPVPTVAFSDIVSVNPVSAAAPSARSRGPPSPHIV